MNYDWFLLHVFVSAFTLEAYCLFSFLQLAPFFGMAVCIMSVNDPELFGLRRSYCRIALYPCEIPGCIHCETGPA